MDASAYLAGYLHQVPVLLVPCIEGRTETFRSCKGGDLGLDQLQIHESGRDEVKPFRSWRDSYCELSGRVERI